MIRCTIKVGAISFAAIYPSTTAAAMAAMALYPDAPSISVRAVR